MGNSGMTSFNIHKYRQAVCVKLLIWVPVSSSLMQYSNLPHAQQKLFLTKLVS